MEKRPSFDQLTQQGHLRGSSLGYNRTSFVAPHREAPLRPGRDEEDGVFVNGNHEPPSPQPQDEPFDIYADFNNAGPKYSAAFIPPSFSNKPADSKGYRPIRNESAKSEANGDLSASVELVTVPRFGPEWKADELRDMTKSGRRAARSEQRQTVWTRWFRDQHGFCGGWGTRRAFVFVIFGLCVLAGVLLAICLPRVPGLSFRSTAPLIGVNITDPNVNVKEAYKNAFSRIPANFSFPALVSLQFDTHSNVLPLHYNSISAEVYETNTLALVATGSIGKLTMPVSQAVPLLLPVTFNYTAVNSSDLTWLHFYESCRNHVNDVGGVRPGIDIRLLIFMNIVGLTSRAGTSTQISGVPCPIELPVDSV